MTRHIIIPDTQCAPGSDLTYLSWVGEYIVDKFAGRKDVKIIHLGDHWDMQSLSSYDEGRRSMEGRRVLADIEAGNRGMQLLSAPLEAYNAKRKQFKEKQWHPEKYILRGNHEDRIRRALDLEPKLDGLLNDSKLLHPGWIAVPFLQRLWLDGIAYAHFFTNPATGQPLGGLMDTRLKNLGHSFIQGHIPGRQFAVRRVASPEGSRELLGIVAGSCYLDGPHIDYQGPQSRDYWNGIIVLHEVANGTGDPLFISIDYLRRKYAR